ncbi:MAG TPA: MBL fold metallo-hydrolase [Streptosporangiaceae bacterium]|nr:MBL fold metallo-hydrolase [Streptosporangiaceae bacterium]
MRITILGCRSGMPADGQASSGYLVATDAATVLLDCGPGVATALGSVTTPDQLSAVIVSHLHLDHCYDLLPLGKSLLSRSVRYPRAGEAPQDWAEIEAVPLHVPGGSRERLQQLASLFPVTTAPVLDRTFDLAFDVREYSPGARFTIGDMRISLHELRHSSPNCGIRISSPAGCLAYTGDTGVTPALLTLAADADLLLAEATLPTTDHGPHGHLSAVDAARAAQAAGVKTLVLTHFPSADPSWLLARRDEAAQAFTGTVHLARPGGTFEIGPDPLANHSSFRKALP